MGHLHIEVKDPSPVCCQPVCFWRLLWQRLEMPQYPFFSPSIMTEHPIFMGHLPTHPGYKLYFLDSLKLSEAMWPSSGQEDVSRSEMCNFFKKKDVCPPSLPSCWLKCGHEGGPSSWAMWTRATSQGWQSNKMEGAWALDDFAEQNHLCLVQAAGILSLLFAAETM